MSVRVPVALLAVLIGSACGDPAVPSVSRDEAAPFQTDSLEYRLRPPEVLGEAFRTRIAVRYRNPGPYSVAFALCARQGLVTVEVKTSAGWQGVSSRNCPSVGVPPITVPPGGTWSDTVLVAHWPGKTNVVWNVDASHLPGVFRLVYMLTDAASMDDPSSEHGWNPESWLPLEQSTSNEFVIRWHSPP